MNATYVSRIRRLTLLAPEIVEAILDGAATSGATAGSSAERVSVGVVRAAIGGAKSV